MMAAAKSLYSVPSPKPPNLCTYRSTINVWVPLTFLVRSENHTAPGHGIKIAHITQIALYPLLPFMPFVIYSYPQWGYFHTFPGKNKLNPCYSLTRMGRPVHLVVIRIFPGQHFPTETPPTKKKRRPQKKMQGVSKMRNLEGHYTSV